jgi:hypothetical protein
VQPPRFRAARRSAFAPVSPRTHCDLAGRIVHTSGPRACNRDPTAKDAGISEGAPPRDARLVAASSSALANGPGGPRTAATGRVRAGRGVRRRRVAARHLAVAGGGAARKSPRTQRGGSR